jgi:hypothetical protein
VNPRQVAGGDGADLAVLLFRSLLIVLACLCIGRWRILEGLAALPLKQGLRYAAC